MSHVTICRMSVATAEASLAEGHEALAAGDWASARGAFARAIAIADVPEALDGLGRNVDAVGEFFADPQVVERVQRGCFSYLRAFPDLHASIEELVAEGDTVVCRSTTTGTQDGEIKGIPPTGRHIAFDSIDIFRIEDGRFAGYWCQSDVAGLMRQLTEERAVAAAEAAAS
jgi:predicted ester cyclase